MLDVHSCDLICLTFDVAGYQLSFKQGVLFTTNVCGIDQTMFGNKHVNGSVVLSRLSRTSRSK